MSNQREDKRETRQRGAASRRVADHSSILIDTTLTSSSPGGHDSSAMRPPRRSDKGKDKDFEQLDLRRRAANTNANAVSANVLTAGAVPRESRESLLGKRLRGAGRRQVTEDFSLHASTSSDPSIGLSSGQTDYSVSRETPIDPRLNSLDSRRRIDLDDDRDLLDDGAYGSETDDYNDDRSFLDMDVTMPLVGVQDGFSDLYSQDDTLITASRNVRKSLAQGLPRGTKRRRLEDGDSRAAAEDSMFPLLNLSSSDDDDYVDQGASRDKGFTINVQKVPLNVGGTNRVTGVDVVADIIDRILQKAESVVSNNGDDVPREPWVARAVQEFHADVTRTSRKLVDIVDVNQALLNNVRRCINARNNLRLRLINVRQRRAELQTELLRARQQHAQTMAAKNAKRDLGNLASELVRLGPDLNDATNYKTDLEADLAHLEPLINRHYGAQKRVKTAKQALQTVLQRLKSTT